MISKIIFIQLTLIYVIKSDPPDTFVNPVILNQDDTINTTNLFEYNKFVTTDDRLTIGLGTKLVLKLALNRKLLNQKSLIERKSRNYTRESYLSIKSSCLFYGKVKNFNNSFVSVSLCDRMRGYIYLNSSVYIIEPYTSDKQNLTHKIYPSEKQLGPDFYMDVPNGRSKRSVSIERTVETLVVADQTITKQYHYLDIENYLLTIMNMVAFIYRDPSLDSNINIVVVRMIIFEDDQPFDVVTNATASLENFCVYQNGINFPDVHVNHHDLAVLITRTDICGREGSCDTSGLANLGSMCDPVRSCNVNEDTGLSLAFSIAHEIGHNFNAEHDTIENGCTNSSSPFLMNPHLSSLRKNQIWSECSRKRINKFLDQADLKCLEDQQSVNLLNYNQPIPGAFYDMEHQCKFAYGENATVCKNFEYQCNEVWCQIKENSVCISKGEAPADGTLCGDGHNYWCMNRECVLIEEFKKPIDGGWGNWSEWSDCNRECNGGIQFIQRKCNNPNPDNGGRYCLGERKRYRICNPQKCDDPLANEKFKNIQCERFNDVPYGADNLKYEWEYHNFGAENPCKLYCKSKTEFFYKNFNENLDDGTPCSDISNDICLNGVCTPVGCDWKLRSNTTNDLCGVCGGDDSSCNVYRGTIEASFPIKGGYQPLFVLPKGARSIRIYEYSKPKAKNYLAIKNLNGSYYMNGQFSITVNTDFKINGVRFFYTSKLKEEAIRSEGPLDEDLLIMLLLLSNDVSVSYFYTLPNNYVAEPKKYYTWEYTNDWSPCSKSCGKGFKKNSPKCIELKEGIVEDLYCWNLAKPIDLFEYCNLIECEPNWWVGEWQECSASCSTSGFGYRKRSVLCVIQKPNHLNEKVELVPVLDRNCKESKPHTLEECKFDMTKCSSDEYPIGYWIAEEWNRKCVVDLCSLETRVVKCSDPNAICDPLIRPISERRCELPVDTKCGRWAVGPWSACNRSCGEASRSRKVQCIGGNICSTLNQPHDVELCYNNPECSEDDLIIADLVITINNPVERSKRNIEMVNQTELNDVLSSNFTDEINNEILPLQTNLEEEIDENSIFFEKLQFNEDEYGFYLSNDSMEYEWEVGSFGTCSRKCGFGSKSRKVECVSKTTHERVHEIKCREKKPNTIEKCIVQECVPWNVTKWSECQTTCGPGYQSRKVFCPHPLKLCDLENVPSKKKPCVSRPCYEWRTDEWSQCSATCGQGFKIRRVYCFNLMTNGTSDYCDKNDIPKTVENCSVVDECPIDTKQADCIDKLSKSLCRMISYSNRCNESYLNSKCCKTCSKQN